MEQEIWKGAIYQGVDYSERLEVSNFGQLRNVKTGTIYKLFRNKHHGKKDVGYIQVCISLGSKEDKKVFKIHKIVAETFVENPFDLPQVNHKDGDKTNNYDWNLEWATNKDNSQHAWNNGLCESKYGCENSNGKLTIDDIQHIYELYYKKYTHRAIGIIIGINHATITRILNNQTYTNETQQLKEQGKI